MKKQSASIDSKLMKKFMERAVQQLEGEWIVIGGTVLPLLGIDLRITVDIDLVNLDIKNSNRQSLQLMEIAESLGLPVETINQAGSYFLSKIDDVRDHLILFQESKKCKIYRPDSYLFLKLKIARLSQSDFEDCSAFVDHDPDDFKNNKKAIALLLKGALKSASSEKKERLIELQKKCI